MKKLILGIFLIGFMATGNSQIELEEVKIKSMKLDPVTQTLVITLPEEKVGEFETDPLYFMKNKFNAKRFVKDNSNSDIIEFYVNFVTSKGNLEARFNKNGELVSSKQRFINIRLPHDVQMEIARLYKGAEITRSKYIAHSKGWDINKEYFKLKLADGDKNRRIRINRENGQLLVAALE